MTKQPVSCWHGVTGYCLQCDAEERMGREVCIHGVEITGGYKRLWCELCEADVVGEEMAAAQKYRRAEWIRNNVALLWIGGSLEYTQRAVDEAEKMVDELIRRGYL